MRRRSAYSEEEKWAIYREKSNHVYVDFDGTLVEFDYPRIGAIKPGAREFLARLRDSGYKVIINSCRTANSMYTVEERMDAMNELAQFLAKNDMHFDAIFMGVDGSAKPLGLAYVDDRAVKADGDFNRMYDEIAALRAEQMARFDERRRGDGED